MGRVALLIQGYRTMREPKSPLFLSLCRPLSYAGGTKPQSSNRMDRMTGIEPAYSGVAILSLASRVTYGSGATCPDQTDDLLLTGELLYH